MKNKDDYLSENPGRPGTNDEAAKYLTPFKPKLGDEADYVADGFDGTDAEDYVIEADDHYAG